MVYSMIERGMVLQDTDGDFVVVRNFGRDLNKLNAAGWYMHVERLDLNEDLTFHPSGYMFFESAYAAESFYSYVGRWPDGK